MFDWVGNFLVVKGVSHLLLGCLLDIIILFFLTQVCGGEGVSGEANSFSKGVTLNSGGVGVVVMIGEFIAKGGREGKG